MATHDIGLIGLAVMGRNLALNIAEHGFSVAAYNRSPEPTAEWERAARSIAAVPVAGVPSVRELCAALTRPRKVVLMIKAGAPTDAVIEQVAAELEPGDVLIDGGNAHPRDTERRSRQLTERGLRFVGMGVSGGEDGARHGPSLMPGGPADAYDELAPILEKIAAQVSEGPCVTHIGPASSGHFVKMVHNGIEYGDMQLIAEIYDVMANGMGMTPAAMAAVFADWNRGPLESFLIEITAQILAEQDPETGRPMVDVILDRAGQKGTGRWTAEAALELGVPLPTIHAAVEARVLSSRLGQRRRAARLLRGPEPWSNAEGITIQALHDALYLAKICSYAQGLDLMRTQSEEQGWQLDLAEVARIWKGGCIIRAKFLDRIRRAFERDATLDNLLLDEDIAGIVHSAQGACRDVVAHATARGIPVLALGASLSYLDSIRRARLPQNLTQAQRDLFGAHTFERVDKAEGETFHHEW